MKFISTKCYTITLRTEYRTILLQNRTISDPKVKPKFSPRLQSSSYPNYPKTSATQKSPDPRIPSRISRRPSSHKKRARGETPSDSSTNELTPKVMRTAVCVMRALCAGYALSYARVASYASIIPFAICAGTSSYPSNSKE